VTIAIVGSGFAGLGMAIALLRAGRRDFVVLEKAAEVGGTWRDNTYPGVACDVASHLYSFSFAPNPNWSRRFSPGPEIQQYLQHCAATSGVLPHIRFGFAVCQARWLQDQQLWRLVAASGEVVLAKYVVAGMGGLHRPLLPQIQGLGDFSGPSFHSAQWRHDIDLRGKRVAVIGTGASAIQFVPEISKVAAEVALYQRTPPWILAKDDAPIAPWKRALFRRLPLLQLLKRALIYTSLELRVPGFTRLPGALRLAQVLALGHLQRQVADPALRRKLTPDYIMGCKRILLSNNYYPALSQPHVQVYTTAISRVVPDGVVLTDGSHQSADVLIYGTGFAATDPLPPGLLFGQDGLDITQAWQNGPEAYLGTAVHGFPNLFLLVGPNTGLGHSSMIYMIESQIAYVLAALQTAERKQARQLVVRRDVQDRYNVRLQQRLLTTVWHRGGCRSWYLHASGKNVSLWPGFTWQFRRATARFVPADYEWQ